MAVVKMSKIQVIGLVSERASMLESLMELGVVEINETEPGDDLKEKTHKPDVHAKIVKLDAQLTELTRSIEILDKYCPAKKPMFFARRIITQEDYAHIMAQRETVLNCAGHINRHEDEIIRLKGEENRQEGLLASLAPWMELDIPLEVASTRHTFSYTGSLSSHTSLQAIEEELYKAFPEAVLIPGKGDREHHYAVVIGLKDKEADILMLLKNYGWNRISLRDMEGLPKENRERIEKRIRALREEREKKVQAIKDLVKERDWLEVVSDGCRMERERMEAHGQLISTKSVFLLNGWVPKELSAKVKEFLEKHYFCFTEIKEPDPGEEYPVLIENGPVVESIAPVLNMYGVPSSREIDPSPIMMPFFVFFFGLMLGDGGYGIIITLATAFILKRFKLEDSTRRFMKLMFFCGLSTIFCGLLFGSWFGISSLSKTALWMSPTENPERMMSWSLLFGIIHMYIGLFLKGLNLVRRGLVWDAIFDVGFVYVLFTGFILSLLPFAPGIDAGSLGGIVKTGNIMFITGVVLMIATQGRKAKSLFGKIFGGVGRLYDVISFLSDTLSYTRLLALGLASSIIGDIVNTMSASFGGNIIMTIIAAALIITVGHVINIGLNVLGAYVHSCRLQYLEFFGKFLEGGGSPFKPFKANTKYVIVRTETSRFLHSGARTLG